MALIGPWPVYVEVAPLARHATTIDHLYILRDNGTLSGPGRQRFASPFSEVRFAVLVTEGKPGLDWQGSRSEVIQQSKARHRPLFGGVAGLRIDRNISAIALPSFPANRAERAIGDLDAVLHALDLAADNISEQVGGTAIAVPDTPRRADQMAGMLGVSVRTLRRRVSTATNIPPKTWLALHRFRNVTGEIARSVASLTDVALEHGYCDQAHLNADFLRRAGLTPGQFRARASTALGADPGRFFKDAGNIERLRLLVSLEPDH